METSVTNGNTTIHFLFLPLRDFLLQYISPYPECYPYVHGVITYTFSSPSHGTRHRETKLKWGYIEVYFPTLTFK